MKRFFLSAVLGLTLAAGSAQAAACTVSASQDAINATNVAMGAANTTLAGMKVAYSVRYTGITYQVVPGPASISGNSAKVRGNIIIRAAERGTGKREDNTYHGTISLLRSGCGWRATGYQPN